MRAGHPIVLELGGRRANRSPVVLITGALTGIDRAAAFTSAQEGINNTNENKTALVSTVPLERLATPEEMARVIAFVASADASCITGALSPWMEQ